METIARRNIRIYYYTSGVLAMLVVSLVVVIPYFVDMQDNFNLLVEEIKNAIMSEKRRNLANIVDRTIKEIDTLRAITLDDCRSLSEAESSFLSRLDVPTLEKLFLNEQGRNYRVDKDGFGFNDFGVVIFDEYRRKIVLSNNKEHSSAFEKNIMEESIDSERFPIVSVSELGKDVTIYVFVSQSSLDKIAKSRAKDIIRNVRFDSDRYIWVNEIINYDGGDDYAIRVVHPNLKSTEGKRLSTNTQDEKGNFPYKIELEGIKKDGNLYFEYYFKKMNSEEVTLKFSYAKLYKPFNWVIATGIHLDEVGRIISQREEVLDNIFREEVKSYTLLILLFFTIYVVVLIVVENKINRMINAFVRTIKEHEGELLLEKNKLDEAYEKLQEVAYVDFLTDLMNRRAMYDKIKEEASRCKRTHSRFCLILSDIDRFKCINDTYGHDVGDIVLKRFSQLLKQSVRKEDGVARWGGEEFLVLATAASLDQGVALAEKLRKAIESVQIVSGDQTIQATMTFGVVECAGDKSIDEIIKEVDKHLYAGKQKGRNCVASPRSVQ